jgi:hypothetical protein
MYSLFRLLRLCGSIIFFLYPLKGLVQNFLLRRLGKT